MKLNNKYYQCIIIFKMKRKKIYLNFFKNIYSKKFLNYLPLILFIIAYYLYYLSLEKCLEGKAACSLRIHWINIKLMEAILSSIILSILIELIFLQFISKLHFIHMIFIFFFFINSVMEKILIIMAFLIFLEFYS